MSCCPANDGEEGVVLRPGAPSDLPAVGEVYVRAFARSLRERGSPRLSPLAIADLAAACVAAEGECITIAQARTPDGPRVIGYTLALRRAERVWRVALRRGLWLRWLRRLVGGRYRLSALGLLSAVTDKLVLGLWWNLPGVSCPARVLSVAVDPGWQGRGIGRRLLEAAVARLRAGGAACVRLEVRPDNAVARRVYEAVGFRRVGRFRDSRGRWEVMLLEWEHRGV